MTPHEWHLTLNIVLPLTMALGGVLSYLLDHGRVRDEREELIQLKSYTVSHWATLTVLMACCLWNLARFPELDTYPILWAVLVASMYGEIGAKVYFRRVL